MPGGRVEKGVLTPRWLEPKWQSESTYAKLTEALGVDMRLDVRIRACVDDWCRAYVNIHTAQSTHAGTWSSGAGVPHRSPRASYLDVVSPIPARPPFSPPPGYCYGHTATLCSLQQYTSGEGIPYPPSRPNVLYCFVVWLLFL